MIPIRDENRSLTSPHVTRMLIIINIILFFFAFLPDLSKPYWLQALFGAVDSPALYKSSLNFGMIPNDVLHGQRLFTFLTSMFLHGDLLHLGSNMLFLYIFGDNVEDTFGHARYAISYVIAGIMASIAHIGSLLYFRDLEGLTLATIGASGAISGVLGAYFVLYPRSRILTLVLLGWIYIVPIPAVIFLGLWFALQILYGTLAPSAMGVAYWAHIGGFVAGLFFGGIWRGRRRKRGF